MSASLASFETHRARLLRVAYRMLGTMADAEDLVQDAYVRWHEASRDDVRSEEGFLVTMTTRLALDRLRRRQTERESYFGSWLPEPWTSEATQDDLGYAALVLLEQLSIDERAAFLLREVFDYDYDFVAQVLEKSEPACRKLVQRAKEHLAVRSGPAKYAVSRDDQRQLLERLVAASRAQSASELEALFAPHARYVSDGGGKVFAARYPLEGAARVASTLWRLMRKLGPTHREELRLLGGEPAIVDYLDGELFSVTFADIRDGQIHGLFKVLNPDKLHALKKIDDGSHKRE